MVEGLTTGLRQLVAWGGEQVADLVDSTTLESERAAGHGDREPSYVTSLLSRATTTLRGVTVNVFKHAIDHSLEDTYLPVLQALVDQQQTSRGVTFEYLDCQYKLSQGHHRGDEL